jgi:16S rRNA (guanine966-N2)-methyltransferase
MRIVGGRHRGRRLVVPPGEAVRPTSDRAREALFNILSHGDFAAAGLPFAGENIVDAFAGTGALGLEALSRGAARAAFIETDRTALAALRRNLAAFDEADAADVIPPYRSSLAAPTLAALDAAGWLVPAALAIVEIAAKEPFSPPSGFAMIDERVYGAARLVFLRREGGKR